MNPSTPTPSDLPQLLVADTPPNAALLRRVIGTRAIVWEVLDMPAAVAALQHRVDLVVCGVYFDDSRMFELLDRVRAAPNLAGVPFVCVRPVKFVGWRLNALRMACEETGVAGPIELPAPDHAPTGVVAEALQAEILSHVRPAASAR